MTIELIKEGIENDWFSTFLLRVLRGFLAA